MYTFDEQCVQNVTSNMNIPVEVIVKFLNHEWTFLGRATRKSTQTTFYNHCEYKLLNVCLGDTMQTLLDLQDKARNVLSNSRTSADPLLLGLIEDLCQICERIKEESKREKLDLLQQVNKAKMFLLKAVCCRASILEL